MNLWIRSQNKEELTNPMYLQIIKVSNNTKYAIISCSEMAGDTTLGFYESKERALEVLDDIDNVKFYKYMASLDIQSFVTSIEKKYSQEEQQFLFNQMNTYKMPKE